ncbi:hypothetical protein [Microbacterium tenebrionis]|uniref:hypothetical protein n=1 Tax=Microbacterium tenebrionis TaxID=2830665 RepID=UPI001588D1B6|nr:hypothetical protein [Microbacterium ihumii]
MTDSSAELRMLRAKAYGPGGELTDAELARLQELEGRARDAAGEDERLRLPAVAQPVVPEPVEGSSAAAAPPPLNDPQDGAAAADESRGRDAGDDFSGSLSERSETTLRQAQGPTEQAERAEASDDAEASSETEAPSHRRRWPLIAASVVATLGIGFGIGWAIWGWDAQSFMLTAAHGDERAELEEQFDPGTVVAVAEQDGIVVWVAERAEEEQTCVVVTLPGRSSSGCMTYDEVAANGWWPSTSVTVPDGQENAGETLIAAVLRGVDGRLVPYIQLQPTVGYDWESQYTDAELAQLRQLEAEGYDPQNLSTLGADGDTTLFYEWDASGLCVVAVLSDGVTEACTEDGTGGLTLSATVDGIPTEYVVTQSEMRGPQLTIYKGVDTEYYFGSSDDPMFDDFFTEEPSIDDKTGS